jgi:hypothetical protein
MKLSFHITIFFFLFFHIATNNYIEGFHSFLMGNKSDSVNGRECRQRLFSVDDLHNYLSSSFLRAHFFGSFRGTVNFK